jgi:predicted GNAT family acetyltransferase
VDAQVADNPAHHRYDVTVGDEVAGFTVYERRPGVIAFMHTEIGEEWGGKGLGSILVRGALDDVRAKGMAVLPYCPFVRSWLERHSDYAELVPVDHRGQFGLA